MRPAIRQPPHGATAGAPLPSLFPSSLESKPRHRRTPAKTATASSARSATSPRSKPKPKSHWQISESAESARAGLAARTLPSNKASEKPIPAKTQRCIGRFKLGILLKYHRTNPPSRGAGVVPPVTAGRGGDVLATGGPSAGAFLGGIADVSGGAGGGNFFAAGGGTAETGNARRMGRQGTHGPGNEDSQAKPIHSMAANRGLGQADPAGATDRRKICQTK